MKTNSKSYSAWHSKSKRNKDLRGEGGVGGWVRTLFRLAPPVTKSKRNRRSMGKYFLKRFLEPWRIHTHTHRSVSRLLAWFCAKLCLQTKTLIFNVLLIFAATNQRRDLWESPPCFDGTDEEFISKFEPKIDGP